MSEDEQEFSIRRILVALDASPLSIAAVEAAADLAAKMNAALEGLFVEDIALLSLSEIPLAREVLYFSTGEAPVTHTGMRSRLRAQSERARTALENAARRARVDCSFRIARGEVASEILAAATGADLLALGRGGWSLNRRLRMGSTALEAAVSTIPVLVLPDRGLPRDVHPLVYYDGSPAARRGLRAAAQLARAGMDGITVLIEAKNQAEEESRKSEADSLLSGESFEARYSPFDPAAGGLPAALKSARSGILVLGGRELLDKLPPLDTVLRKLEIPLLLLGRE